MKRLIAVLAVLALAVTGQAANIDAGTYELELGGGIDFDGPSGTQFDLNAGMGYFVADYIEVGVRIALSDNDDVGSYGLGVFGEYNFDLGTQLVPFVGADVSWFNVDVEGEFVDESEDAGVLGVYGGVKYFLTEDVALYAQAEAELASEDIYLEDDDVENTNFLITWGIRYHFDM